MLFKPIAEPRIIDEAYSPGQVERLFALLRDEGPWPTVMAHHFATPEELIASTSGVVPPGARLNWDDYVGPVFRGALGIGGTCLYPAIEDLFLNPKFLGLARDYWGALHARPELMQFSIAAPMVAGDLGHFDAMDFRGVVSSNTPAWLLNTMARSGLFERWIARKAQVIVWFYRGRIGGGFTYWPDGPSGRPKRLHAPMWNRGIVVQNEHMFHKADDAGPLELRDNAGVRYQSLCGADPDSADGWRITTDGAIVKRLPESEMRFMIHWSAEVFMDRADLARALEHKDDLTHQKVFDIFLADLRARGIAARMPADPLGDRDFIALLTQSYRQEVPRVSPEEERALEAARLA
ncbi:MAG TPA: hypothetical protein VN231_13305 [Allosphingosinicella sp.]|nr:hypothetical protein [Allosphingosinicella sp.]